MENNQKILDFTQRTRDKSPRDAADWLAKLDRSELTKEERAELKAWLEENPENQAALREYATFWYGLNEPLRDLGLMKVRTRRRRVKLHVVAASIALLGAVVLGLFTLNSARLNESVITAEHSTSVGEVHVVALEDGSTIHLNTNSVVKQAFTHKERRITLVSGEAIFDVAHDTKRPFVVHASRGVIRAVGTRFAVRVHKDKVSVTVTEGSVAIDQVRNTSLGSLELSNQPETEPASVTVSQGEAADIDSESGRAKQFVSDRDIMERTSWTNGQLVFYDRELQSVIDEVARYTNVEIKVMEDKLKAEKLTGVLNISDLDQMLDGIEGALGVTVIWIDNSVVHITTS